jgi:hypothetical protein
MWLKFFWLLALMEFIATQKMDYEYEELDLECSFEFMNEK